jgi:hypothetical protein
MNKAEAMFRAFFEDDAEYVLFYLAHRVQIEKLALTAAAGSERCDEVRVFDDEGELAVFDDKPNFIRVYDSIAVVAYVRKAEGRPDTMCAAGPGYECHRPVENGPAQMAQFHDGTIVEQYWVHGARLLRQDVELSQGLGDDRIASSDAHSTANLR